MIKKQKKRKRKSYVKEKFTREQVKNAIIKGGGLINPISKILGCDWHTTKRMIDGDEDYKELIQIESEKIIDDSITGVKQLVRNGIECAEKDYLPVFKYVLGTIGKKRGWVERQEIDHMGNIDSKIEVEIIRNNIEKNNKKSK